ncbi:MAG: O-antigen ligase family protein [Acetobacteraceae bacterium]|nr:O-antigen ligase family protein [Acetobacteraceae bacterium]
MLLGHAPAAKARVPLFFVVFIPLATLLPAEINVIAGQARVTPARILIWSSVIPLIVAFAMQIGAARNRIVASDVVLILFMLWGLVALTVSEGVDRAVVVMGSVGAELVVGYLAARVFPREPGSEGEVTRVLVLCTLVMVPFALADSLSSSYLTRNIIAEAVGSPTWPTRPDEFRLGIHRAMTLSDHPIHFGTLCTVALTLTFVQRMKFRLAIMGALAVGLFLSLSSAPWLGAILSAGVLTFALAFPRLPGRWMTIIGLTLLLVVAFIIVHPNPWGYLVSTLTIDPSTGYYRLMLWSFAGELVLQNPVFGVGSSVEWQRPDWLVSTTVDGHFLRMAMVYGIPGSILWVLLMVSSATTTVDTDQPIGLDAADRRLGLGLSVCIFAFIYIGATVTYWNQLWIVTAIIAGLRANLGARARMG